MTNIVFFLFWCFSSPRIQELASRSPSQTLEDGKKNYTCSTTHRALPSFRRSPPQQLKKKLWKKCYQRSEILQSPFLVEFLKFIALTTRSFFFLLSSSFFSTFYLSFGQSLRCGHYQPTYQPPEGVYTLNSGITQNKMIWI